MILPNPPPFFPNPKWFDFSSIDRDTIKWHLGNTCNEVATLVSAHAEALYYEEESARLAKKREKHLFLVYKGRPHPRINKAKECVLEDGSDPYAAAVGQADEEVNNLRALELLWKRRRVELAGILNNFDKKSVYLATLGGVLRSELHMTR